jgi:uncharacterized membrane protein SpoIIM required for sporulation
VIANLNRFILRRRPDWEEYESRLQRLEDDVSLRLDLDGIQRLRFLHESVAADLMRIRSFSAEPETIAYLESLLARGFGFIHENRSFRGGFSPRRAFVRFAEVVRGNAGAFLLVLTALLLGALLGGVWVAVDPDVKEVILPFPHLLGSPSDRVAEEEAAVSSVSEAHSSFAAQLMANNIRVSILVLVLGIFYGVFTLILVFYNGVILGAVIVDYLLAGEGVFLAAWLLPHGSVEIPAILFSAQAGLLITRALMFQEKRQSLAARLRGVRPDITVLIGGVVLLLVWAGLIESFFSQYHAPVLPYSAKILFGVIQSAGLLAWLLLAGKGEKGEKKP